MSSPRLPHRALHLISARGGGSARFARDLAANAEGHQLLHVGDEFWVVEEPGEPAVFRPYQLPAASAGEWLQAMLDAHGAELLHVHFLHALTLPVLEAWCPARRPWVISLHDIGFLRGDTFAADQPLPSPDPEWVRRWRPLLAKAALITAPSQFLADLFVATYPGLTARVIAPGVDLADLVPQACADVARSDGPLTLGVVGALGPHKGKERLLRWLNHADAGRFRWVLIGYTDDQLQPGWLGDRLWVHGPFMPEDTAHWLRHYAVDLVLFPNRMAESFSYALSDVWAAGIPVLVPDLGALGERVAHHGGGAVMAAPDSADAVMSMLLDLIESPEPQPGADATATTSGNHGSHRLRLRDWRLQIGHRRAQMAPTIRQMVNAMRNAYLEAHLPAGGHARGNAEASTAYLQQFLRTQLDDSVFRHENIRLARDYGQVRVWAEKLERDVDRMASDLAALGQTRAELDRQLIRRDAHIEMLRGRNEAIEQSLSALHERNQRVETTAAALDAQLRAEIAVTAELRSHEVHLTTQLVDACRHRQQLVDISSAQALEIIVMHQRINALVEELRPLRIKGARYDRARAWLPAWVLPWVRRCRDWLVPRIRMRKPI